MKHTVPFAFEDLNAIPTAGEAIYDEILESRRRYYVAVLPNASPTIEGPYFWSDAEQKYGSVSLLHACLLYEFWRDKIVIWKQYGFPQVPAKTQKFDVVCFVMAISGPFLC